jgi:type IX secretion system PorP/SprF family membrane protein
VPVMVLCFLIVGTVSYAQQESMYSQYMFNMLHVNPAYAGSRASDNISMIYRNQWVGVAGAPKTASISWDRRVPDHNMGYGIEIYNDRLGVEKTTGVQGFYSYHIPFVASYLVLGVSGGVLNYRAALPESVIVTGGDPVFQKEANGWLPTAGFGIAYATPLWYMAFSIPALLHTKIEVQNSLDQKSFGASNHYFFTGGYQFELSETMKLKPSVMVKAVKGSPIQCDLNTNLWFNDVLGFGLSYRIQDSFVGLFELQITPQLRLGYAYDYTFSDFGVYNKGTHEVMLRFEIPNKPICPACKERQD